MTLVSPLARCTRLALTLLAVAATGCEAYDPELFVPLITSVAPAHGPSAGGTTVLIDGSRMATVTSVTFGAVRSESVGLVSDSELTALTPPGSGSVPMIIHTTRGQSRPFTFTYDVSTLSTLTAIDPAVGPATGANTVTLSGTGLSGTTAVTFGTTPATSVTAISDTQVTAVAPAGTGTVQVTATTPFGTTNGLSYAYGDSPILTSLAPSNGPGAGGTSVVITGTNLTGVTSVSFGGSAATSFTVDSDTSITAASPAGAGIVGVVANKGVNASNGLPFAYDEGAPTVATIAPSVGPTAGGTTVSITGTNLVGATSVTFDGTAGTSLAVSLVGTITVVTPAHATGPVDVVVTAPGGTVTATAGFIYNDGPAITGVTPDAGPLAGGTHVTLTGLHLTGATGLTFGGVAATAVTVVSDTSITATTPANPAGAVDVIVTTASGSGTKVNGFTYEVAPKISSLSPSAGPAIGGTTVTISGTNLATATSVTIDNASVAFTLAGGSLQFVTPSHATGAVMVTVTTPGGSDSATYTYNTVVTGAPAITNIAPPAGPTAGGTNVIINGLNLTGTTSVTFGGVAATNLIVVNPGTVTVTTPAGAAGSVDVVLTTASGSTTSQDGFTYVAPPTISSITPNNGSVLGLTQVTIDGTNLSNAVVKVGGTTVLATTSTSTTFVFLTPGHAAGAVTVTVTTAGGTASTTYTYNAIVTAGAPTLTTVSPNSGPSAGNVLAVITLTGTNFVNVQSVTFGGVTAPATLLEPLSTTSYTVSVPAHAPGVVDVTITTASGSATLANAFTYN